MQHIRSIFENTQKTEVVESIHTEVVFTWQYFILLTLSVVIATLGLLLGNTAIIIGAMILSPFI